MVAMETGFSKKKKRFRKPQKVNPISIWVGTSISDVVSIWLTLQHQGVGFVTRNTTDSRARRLGRVLSYFKRLKSILGTTGGHPSRDPPPPRQTTMVSVYFILEDSRFEPQTVYIPW